ncbi:coiled-coil domain-containing protein 175-like [Protopterus annectens]|uniref:coiled-coil domain-containing protein 175-like n=1 Tax=Protopterus annectens TaxID=7888 RepID=UPI001CF9ADC5|nr:coiled-coil domain-containing protein 175-like [Protopterus annectens]
MKHSHGESVLQHLTEIADLIKELEQARKNVHDLLEVETIEVSKLRFKCSNLPHEFCKEIEDAVFATRNSNASQLNHLQTELKSITDEIELTEEKQNRLKKQNRFLIPELERLKIQHVDVIEQLNQQMAEKANKRIILNDTYDKVRGAQKAVVNLKDAIEDMEEVMTNERKEFNEEKERLMKKNRDSNPVKCFSSGSPPEECSLSSTVANMRDFQWEQKDMSES